MRILAALLLANSAAALQPQASATRLRVPPRQGHQSPLLAASASSEGTVTGNIAAGMYSGLATVIDCAAFSSIVFAPVGLPLTTGFQHGLVGFVLMQAVVTRLSNIKFMLAPTSYEVMPFLVKFAAVAAAAGASGASLLATVLAASVLVGLLGSAIVFLMAELPVDDVDKLLPPPLQAGLFAAIGWSLYLLAFDSLGLSFSFSSAMLQWTSARLWMPANLLGLGLWFAARNVDSPALFPGFIVGVTAVVHAVRMFTGTSVAGARAAGWLMAEAAGAPATQLWRSFAPSFVRWDILASPAGFAPLLAAALFGPVVNTVLNYVLAGPLFKMRLDLRRELRSHATGAAAAAVAGGYSSYAALSNTAIHKKVGGTAALSTYVASAVCALFLLVYPLTASVGFVPTLVIAAICVYIGADFLWDNLIDPLIGALKPAASGRRLRQLAEVGASWAVLLVCVQKDMLLGTVLGIVGFQIANRLQKKPAE